MLIDQRVWFIWIENIKGFINNVSGKNRLLFCLNAYILTNILYKC